MPVWFLIHGKTTPPGQMLIDAISVDYLPDIRYLSAAIVLFAMAVLKIRNIACGYPYRNSEQQSTNPIGYRAIAASAAPGQQSWRFTEAAVPGCWPELLARATEPGC